MKAEQAINELDPTRWTLTPVVERLHILEQIRENIKQYGDELGLSDAKMKNAIMGEPIFFLTESKLATMVPVANIITAAIGLYETLLHEKMPSALNISKLADNYHKVDVFPQTHKEKILSGHQLGSLYVRGEVIQKNPTEKPAGIVAVLGAGNYSSSLEMVKALFFDNCAVVHKPHQLNANTDKIWEKIFAPLIKVNAMRFVDADQGAELTKNPKLSKIYFTGGTKTAEIILSATSTPLVSECGGNNPCIIVPGDKDWTDKEIKHQAVQIASMAKLNGGAVCGRVQTLITSKHWAQREQFLDALKEAIKTGTPAGGSYYPNSDKVWTGFLQAYPDAEIIEPEQGRFEHGRFMLISGAKPDGYAAKTEAFCQILVEIPLDLPTNTDQFLPPAVTYCNEQMLGSLAATILVDENTRKKHQSIIEQAIIDLNYGGITVNTMPPFIFLNPYLTWGGNEQREGASFVSGQGNFGNLLGFENIEKSVLVDSFMSMGHIMNDNKAKMDATYTGMARYSVEPTWINLMKLIGESLYATTKGKGF